VLAVQAVEPRGLGFPLQVLLRCLGQLDEVRGVAIVRVRRLVWCHGELLSRELSQRLEQP
jgi:hypothetical protein